MSSVQPTYLFVIDSFGGGGAERSLLEMVPHLSSRGIRVIVVCLKRQDVGFEQEAIERGLDVRFLEGGNRLAKVRSLREIVGREKPNLVYTCLFEADLVGRLATLGYDVPVMVGLVNTSYDPARLSDPNIVAWRLRAVQLVDRLLARFRTAHFHAVSQAVKDSTMSTLGVPAGRITVVHRGRDAERLGEHTPQRRASTRQMLGLSDEAEVVLAVGRQEYQKDHVSLVEAFQSVVNRRPRARLLIAGRAGHASSGIQDRIDSLGLGPVVSLLGHRSDVTDIMAASDLFVFPSLYEGAAGALIEAMALGVPAVVSDIPALREVVEAAESADVVAPRDVAGLADAIVGLLGDPERMERYRRRSRQIFQERFRSERATVELVDLLDSVARS